MNKLHSSALLVLLGVLVAVPVLAEGVAPTNSKAVREDRVQYDKDVKDFETDYVDSRNTVREKVQAAQKDFEMKRKAIQDAFQIKPERAIKPFIENAGSTSSEVKARREEIAGKLQERRAAFKEELLVRKEAIREQVAERKEILRERLGAITDERKAQIALRVDSQLTLINEARVAFFTSALDRIEAVLERLAARTDADAAASQISLAEAAIESARDKVAVQASQDYTVTVTDEAGIRSNLQAVRDQLREDLHAVRDAVRAAHQAVRMVAITLDRLPGAEDTGPTSTTSTL